MSELKKVVLNGIQLWAPSGLPQADREVLFREVHVPRKKGGRRLEGRGSTSYAKLSDGRTVITKQYRRGGVLRYLVAGRYFRWGRPRPHREFEMLEIVRNLGVAVPRPIAFMIEGGLLYRGWLVTEQLKATKSLADYSESELEQVRQLMPQLADQVNTLIENSICHVDLHPGNVLINTTVGEQAVYLIDFDKSYYFKGTKKELRDYYLCRWRRAVIKHGLPDLLIEMVSSELRRRYV